MAACPDGNERPCPCPPGLQKGRKTSVPPNCTMSAGLGLPQWSLKTVFTIRPGTQGQKCNDEKSGRPVVPQPLDEKTEHESGHAQRAEGQGGDVAVAVEEFPGLAASLGPARAGHVEQGRDGQIGARRLQNNRSGRNGQQGDEEFEEQASVHLSS